MSDGHTKQIQLKAALTKLQLLPDLQIRCWTETDFPDIQYLSIRQGWLTPQIRSEETLFAWQQSWPALVIANEDRVIGFVRGITDGEVTTYIAELLVDPDYRGKGIGRLLLDICHILYPHTRLDLVSTEEATSFYKATGFRLIGEGLRKSYR